MKKFYFTNITIENLLVVKVTTENNNNHKKRGKRDIAWKEKAIDLQLKNQCLSSKVKIFNLTATTIKKKKYNAFSKISGLYFEKKNGKLDLEKNLHEN